jgi:hypothetical protein
MLDPKKLDSLKQILDDIAMKAEVEPKVTKDGDNTAYFQSLEKKFNRKKKRYAD